MEYGYWKYPGIVLSSLVGLYSLSLFSPEPRRLRGGLMSAYSSSQGESGSSTEICSLVTVTGPEGMAWSYVRGGSGWVWGKGSSPEGAGHGTDSPRPWARPQAAGVQKLNVQLPLDNARVWIWGGPVWSQGLHSVILVRPFQEGILCDSMK